MNVLFSTETPVPVRLTHERETEEPGVSAYAFGVLLLVALVGVPALMRVLAYVPSL